MGRRPKLIGDKDRLIPPDLRARVLAHLAAEARRARKTPLALERETTVRAREAVRMAIVLADQAGLRISEVVKLRGADCDVDRKPYRLFIRGAKHRKAAHVDEQPIGEELARFLRGTLYAGSKRIMDDRYVVGWRVKPYARQHILRLTKQLHEACGVPAIYNFHSWRHGYGTRIYLATKDLVLTSRMLRHRSVKPTERYIHMAQAGSELDNVLAAIADAPRAPRHSPRTPQRPRQKAQKAKR